MGSIIYGVANFAFLAVVTNALGAERAGPVVVAIAIFTVVSRVAELMQADSAFAEDVELLRRMLET